jgi:hypothetical protein
MLLVVGPETTREVGVNVSRVLAPLLVLLAARSSPALDVRRVRELQLHSGGFVEWIHADRYVRMKTEWDRTPRGASVTFVVADLREQKLLRLPFALEDFRRAHPTLFTGPPGVELLHFDGTSALVRFDRREPERTLSYYASWNPATQTVTEPRALGEVVYASIAGKRQVSRLTYLVGPDPAASRLYFAEVTYDDRPKRGDLGPLAIRFFRLTFPDLAEDGWELALALPRRGRQLPAETYRAFSPDGRRFALAEYYDRASERESRAVPPPQVYVLDLERRTVSRYPIPRTPYGLAFSRDGRYLAVGSHEEAQIIRIDLDAGRIDRRVKSQTHIQAFATTASGSSLLVMSDHIGVPRSIEVRRWSDLGLQETIPVSRLFPGLAGFDPSGVHASQDGRWLVTPRYAPDGYPDRADAGLVTFAIDERPAAPSVARADPAALVRAHVERYGVRLYQYFLNRVGNGDGYVAPMAGNAQGEAFVIGTTSDLPEDAPYRSGTTQPYAIWVDAKGKVVWARSLRSGTTFTDYQGAGAVATPEGDFVAFVLCSIGPHGGAYGRIVRLDRRGRVVWDWTSPVGKNARFPESVQLTESGIVLMKGHLGTSQTPWVGALDVRTGKLVRDDVGAAE